MTVAKWFDRRRAVAVVYAAFLLVLLAVALVPRLLIFDFSLPYIDYPDEPTFYTIVQAWQGEGPMPANGSAYPPGYTVVVFLVETVLDGLGYDGVSPVVWVLRLISVGLDVGIVALVAATARLVGGDLGGVVAAAFWVFARRLLVMTVLALADPLVTWLSVLALFLAVTALVEARRRQWAVWSVWIGIAAVLVKYPAAPAILPGLLVVLYLDRRGDRARARRLLRWQLAPLVAGGVLLLGYVLVTGSDRLARLAEFGNLFTWEYVKTHLELTALALHPDRTGLVLVLGVGAAALALAHRQRRSPPETNVALAVVLVYAVALAWFPIAFFAEISLTSRLRDVLPAATVLCVWLGIAAAQVVRVFPTRWQGVAQWGIVGVLAVHFFLPQLPRLERIVERYNRPDRRVDLMHWMDASVPSGAYISARENHKTFNRDWGGYAGVHDYWQVMTADVRERPIEEWRELGVMYAIPNDAEYQAMVREGSPYLDEVTLLKRYPASAAYRDSGMAVLRLYPIQYPAAGQLGSVHLVGYDLDRATVRAGESVTFTLYWRAERPTAVPYEVYNHLTPPDSRDIVAQVDGPPLSDPLQRRPTTAWDDPDETLMSRTFTLTIAPDVEAGRYRLLTGFYNRDTWQRLVAPDGSDFLVVAEIIVRHAESGRDG